MNYHLLHGEIKNYFGKSDKLKQISYKEFLSISWQMITIVEQLLLLIDSKKLQKMILQLLKIQLTLYVTYCL